MVVNLYFPTKMFMFIKLVVYMFIASASFDVQILKKDKNSHNLECMEREKECIKCQIQV